MSKKDYQAIARAFYLERDGAEFRGQMGTWMRLQEKMAQLLALDNPRFDRGRFIEACETGRCKGMRPVAA